MYGAAQQQLRPNFVLLTRPRGTTSSSGDCGLTSQNCILPETSVHKVPHQEQIERIHGDEVPQEDVGAFEAIPTTEFIQAGTKEVTVLKDHKLAGATLSPTIEEAYVC